MEGANIAIGGHTDATQNYIEPTVLADCKPSDAAMQNEVSFWVGRSVASGCKQPARHDGCT